MTRVATYVFVRPIELHTLFPSASIREKLSSVRICNPFGFMNASMTNQKRGVILKDHLSEGPNSEAAFSSSALAVTLISYHQSSDPITTWWPCSVQRSFGHAMPCCCVMSLAPSPPKFQLSSNWHMAQLESFCRCEACLNQLGSSEFYVAGRNLKWLSDA